MSKLQSMRDFSGGVVNQELQNRDDGRGVIIDANNVVSSPNGELRKRTGTKYLAELPYKTKLVPFRIENGGDVVLAFMQRGDGADLSVGKVIGYNYSDSSLSRFYNINIGDVPEMPTPESWTSTTNGDWVVGGSGFSFNPGLANNNQIYYIFRVFDWQWDILRSDLMCAPNYSGNGPFVFDIANTNTALFMQKIKFKFGGYSPSPSYYSYLIDPTIEYSDDGVTWTPCPTIFEIGEKRSGTVTYFDTFYVTTAEIIVSQNTVFSEHHYWRVSFAGKHIPEEYEIYLSTAIVSIDWGKASGSVLFEANTNFGFEDIDVLQYAQSGNAMYLTSGTNKQPMKISYNNGVFTIADFTPSDESTIWQTNGFPACVEVFQNRLCFAGFTAFPGRVLMSEFGQLENFHIPNPVLPTSPISADSLQLKSRVDFLWGGDKALYGLSAEGVSMIDAGGGVVATDQIEFQLRNREPAAGIAPTVKDDIMVYLGRDQSKVLITDFDFVVQRYRAVMLSTGYDNFLSKGVKELHYIPTKARLIYGILKDGTGFTILFDQALSKNALYPFAISGSMYDITPLKYQDTTKLLVVASWGNAWGIVQKEPQSDAQMMDFMSEDEQKNYTRNFISQTAFMDSVQQYSTDTDVVYAPINQPVSNTSYIGVVADGVYYTVQPTQKTLYMVNNANFTTKFYVQAMADGENVWVKNSETGVWEFYGNLTVSGGVMSINGITLVDGGETLDVFACVLVEPATNVTIGVPYNSYAVIKFISPYMIRKFPREIGVNFINTGYLELGNSFNDMRPVLGNIADTVTLDNMPILMNGNYEKTLDKQAFETPYVIVRSDKGLPFTITGIDYEIDYSNYQGGV